MIRVEQRPGTLIFPVRVTPRGGKGCFLPYVDGDEAIRVKVAAPPEDGKANAAVLALFGETLRLAKSRVRLAGGEKNRNKRVAVECTHPQDAAALLQALARAMDSNPEACFQSC